MGSSNRMHHYFRTYTTTAYVRGHEGQVPASYSTYVGPNGLPDRSTQGTGTDTTETSDRVTLSPASTSLAVRESLFLCTICTVET